MTADSGSTIRIGMWSGPRNLSTAMMRSWENRSDTVVMDEPLYAAYLTATDYEHPMRSEILAAQPTEYAAVIDRCLAPLPDGIAVSYQKHMTHHLLADTPTGWILGLTNVILLRDPRRVIASYTRKRAEVTLDEIGLPQQVRLVQMLDSPLVIDSSDFLADPEAGCRLICDFAGVDFDPAMLAWPAGRRSTDGVWAPAWYDSVWASTGFVVPAPDLPLPTADPRHRELVDEAMELYEALVRLT